MTDRNNRSISAQTGKDSSYSQSFKNFNPVANFTYNFSRSKTLRFNYNGRTNQPSIDQLQDVIVPDETNPLLFYTGNPDLKQEFSHSFRVNYNTFNATTFRFLSVNLNFGATQNKIVNNIIVNKVTEHKHIDLQMPMEFMDGSSFITLGLPLRGKLKGSSLNFDNRIIIQSRRQLS